MLKEQKIAKQVLDSIALTQQTMLDLSQAIKDENYAHVETISDEIRELFIALYRTEKQFASGNCILNLENISATLMDSLNRSLSFVPDNREKTLHKIEFELFSLLKEAYSNFYFWGDVYPDPEQMKYYYEHEKKTLCGNTYIEASEKSGTYKYELSITVMGYNKLDYTKQCVESILKTIPKGLNYELILINHGSTDGTKEFFESIHPTKQIDIKINGSVSTELSWRIIEGEYAIFFSNDVIATENAIENMLRCVKSDPQNGMVVPTTPNISNLQEIPSNYSTIDEMHSFAAHNNHYDPFRHEQRAWLANPVLCVKSSTFFNISYLGHFFTDANPSFSFGDNLMSMLFRRSGYKNVLAKDAYCYHFGSLTIRDDVREYQQEHGEQNVYAQGRRDFLRVFGIDPHGTGHCYDPNMVQLVEFLPFEQINILGINSGLGSNPLKTKELYKEKKHKLSTTVYNVTDQQNYMDDLRGVSDHVKFIQNINCIFKTSDDDFPDRFHHIIIDAPRSSFKPYKKFIMGRVDKFIKELIKEFKLMKDCINHLDDDGSLYVIYETNLQKPQKLVMKILFPKISFNANCVKIKR